MASAAREVHAVLIPQIKRRAKQIQKWLVWQEDGEVVRRTHSNEK
jgi:hypothetical protein